MSNIMVRTYDDQLIALSNDNELPQTNQLVISEEVSTQRQGQTEVKLATASENDWFKRMQNRLSGRT